MTSINNLANEIAKQLKAYTSEVTEQIQESQKTVAKEGANKLKQTSPKDTGEYAKGWRVKKQDKTFVIHNATNYQLTHLLEKGHANVGGGRTAPRVHIAPVETEVIEKFTSDVERILRG